MTMRVLAVRAPTLTGAALITALSAVRAAYPQAAITVQVAGRPLPAADVIVHLDAEGRATTERPRTPPQTTPLPRPLPVITAIPPQPKKTGG